MKRQKLTQEQRQAVQRAGKDALRAYFTGDGARTRILQYTRAALISSATWTCQFIALASWAIVAGLLAGPDHEQFLTVLHAWMVATPLDQVLTQTHEWFMMGAWECVKFGCIFGSLKKLLDIVTPAMDEARQQFAPV